MGARSRSIAMASMPHSMPLPGPSRPHVKTVNCPVRNVGSAVDAVLVLHDGDVAQVQLCGRPVERGEVIGDELRDHLVAGSWCGRVDEANDPALVGGGVQEGVA